MPKTHWRLSWLVLLAAWGIFPASGEPLKTLHGHVPAAVAHLNPTGRLAATTRMRLAIGVPLRDQAGLDNFRAQLCDPASPNYRHYLTPSEFADRFGPTAQDYEAVKEFARTNGLTVTATFANRLVLDVAGPSAAVEKAFHITLHTYKHPTDGRDFFAPDTEPTVEATLPVADVSGLNNYQLPHPKLRPMKAAENASPKGGSAPDGSSYIGADLRSAYVPGATLRGSGQMVGLFEFDGYYANDITSYESTSGYTNVPVSNVLLNEVSGAPGYSGIAGADGEVSLDIEMAIAIAPALAEVIVYEGSDQNTILGQMASDNQAKQLSCSWGWPGGPSTTTDAIFQEMITQGQSFFNASGDYDAFAAGSANDVDSALQANAPSSCPYITQVGGTTLTTGTGAKYTSETVWTDGAGVGSSGGISTVYTNGFSWQTNISNMASRGGSTTHRNIPDVAAVAADVWVIYDDANAGAFGGTSCAAPLWAGFMALVNQQAAANGRPAAGFINPAVYAIAASPTYATCFHDVTTGNNTWSSSPRLFDAMTGYDLCTGLGTPMGTNLINALAGVADALRVLPATGYAAAGPFSGPFNPGSGAFHLTNSSGAGFNWSLSITSAWLTADIVSGTLAAHGTSTVNVSLTAMASSLPVGSYFSAVTFTDLTSQAVLRFPFTLQINQPMSVSPVKGFTAGGPVGGPFTSASQTFVLTNVGNSTIYWGIVNTSAWLSVFPSGGSLATGGSGSVGASISVSANSLAAGIYNTSLVFSNPAGTVATVPVTLSIGQPVIQNGGFETGDFTDWTQSGSTASTIVVGTSTGASYVHSGVYAAELGPPTAPGYLTQNLTTSAGQIYFLSLWLRNPTGRTPNQFQVQWNGATLFARSNITTTAWTNLQFLVTAASTVTPLQFGFQNDPDYFGLDDINVTPLAPAAFKSAASSANAFQLTLNVTPGVVYQVQYATNLAQPNWLNLGSTTTASASTLTVTDTNSVKASPQRYYRLLMSP